MSASCCDHCHADRAVQQLRDKTYRLVLWAVLAINGAMFAIEIGAGLASRSASLQADSLDFLGDAANYAISLFVLGMALRVRARAALVKALTMGVFGIWVIGVAGWNFYAGVTPQASTMGLVGMTALIANAVAFGLIWQFRDGDSNMRSAWICTRNDVMGNIAVMLAALGVFGTGTGWPDAIVAAVMGALAIQGSVAVARQAMAELHPVRVAPAEEFATVRSLHSIAAGE